MLEKSRRWLVAWVFFILALHLLGALLLPWLADSSYLHAYHQLLEMQIWGQSAPPAARAQQIWWMRLFAATISGMSVWMLGLAWWGARQRAAQAWLWLIAGLVLWAPQDIAFSLQYAIWAHVWVDLAALLALLPPLFLLWRCDRLQHKV